MSTTERQDRKDRRKSLKGLTDQTIPPDRVWCCALAFEPLEEHLSKVSMTLTHFLRTLVRADLERFNRAEQDGLSAALASLNRLDQVRLSIHRCELSAGCPVVGRHPRRWQQWCIRQILRF